MNFTFNPRDGLVLVAAEIVGPTGRAVLRLALDTGATSTLINTALLVSVGYDPGTAPNRVQVTTGSGIEFAPCIEVQELTALGIDREGFAVLAHTLPPSASVDGLLGLDFMRGQKVTLDFLVGEVSIS